MSVSPEQIAKEIAAAYHAAAIFTGESQLANRDYTVKLRDPHPQQLRFIESKAKRKVIRAGRRGGKTVGIGILAVKYFKAGKRVLYAAPTQDQIDRFWFEITEALHDGIEKGILYKNETKHLIEIPRTENRIRAKTAWNADTLRGDYGDLLIFDEWQLMNEETWEKVGSPMMLDKNGDAVFIYTPPSIHQARERAVTTKARDPRHAAKMYKHAVADSSGFWEAFHFSSLDNPYLSDEAMQHIKRDMSVAAYEQEILALDKEDNPNALWQREWIDAKRVDFVPDLNRIVVAIDPSATATGDEAGIVVAGIGKCACSGKIEEHGFLLEDSSLQASPKIWAQAAVAAYHKWKADKLIAESNNGGEMVSLTISTVPNAPVVCLIHASRGKLTRAEPVSALYEQGKVHHLGYFGKLEDEFCFWQPGMDSPNRLDAAVWALTELMLNRFQWFAA